MAYELRAPVNYLAGTLSVAASISDTTLTAAVFANLATTYSTTQYLPLVLHDPSAGTYETVWVTAHASSSTSVTVIRARESSTAQAWPSGTRVICAPTTRDVVSATTLAGLPTDASIGTRVAVTDKSYVAERASVGWVPSAGIALADHIGPNRSAANPPSSSTILVRMAYHSGLSDSSGQVAVTYRQAFPTATIGVMITPAGSPGGVTFYSAPAETASGFTAMAWRVTDLDPYTTIGMPAGQTCNFHYLAVGY